MNVTNLKKEFPVFDKHPNLCYLDSAASSLKPRCVIEMMDYYYNNLACNVHRGVYELSYEATDLYENARHKIAKFINSKFEEVVFTRGTSAALNLVAQSYGMDNLEEGDEVITSELEHHSSHMPWFNVCKRKKAILKYIPLTKEGRITIENFKKVLTAKTKIVALTYVSNVMGYITPIKEIIELCHRQGAIVIVDAAQAIPHMKVDVKDLDCDFLAFSGHKMCGPTGIGVLYGKSKLLNQMEPIDFGGDMADVVTLDSQTYKDAPYKFETGTPPIAEAIGLGRACDFLDSIGLEEIKAYEKMLAHKAIELLSQIPDVEIYNKTTDTGVIAFNINGVHPHDAASIYDKNGVCIRAGHHCAQLITNFLGQISTTRASFYFYNTMDDVKRLVDSVREAREFFKAF